MTLKKPVDIAATFQRQWQKSSRRLELLLDETSWPRIVTIPRPTAVEVREHLIEVDEHLQSWRRCRTGEVTWEATSYRSLAEPLPIPTQLSLENCDDWIRFASDREIQSEYRKLATVFQVINPSFRETLIRRRSIINKLSAADCIDACRIADALSKDCANGTPLRGITVEGIDTKFIERHEGLITDLLEVRFGSEVRHSGLQGFLGCSPQHHQWLLVVDLDGGLLPVEQMRVRDTELMRQALPGDHLIVVENEQCTHQLPQLENTLAVLGTGLNLSWLAAEWVEEKQLAYWGDVDTWGLQMLSTARTLQPSLHALLMDTEVFEQFCVQHAVSEPAPVKSVPACLTEQEKTLFLTLLDSGLGRLEQEKLPVPLVHNSMNQWARVNRT